MTVYELEKAIGIKPARIRVLARVMKMQEGTDYIYKQSATGKPMKFFYEIAIEKLKNRNKKRGNRWKK